MGKFKDSIHDIILGERLSDNMYLDNNGQLICENVVLARTGSYDYLESELMDDGDPNKVVQVFRTPEEVFNPISIKSMNYKPFVDEHPEENVTPETVSQLQKGFMTNVRRGTGEFSECLMADLVVTDPYVIEKIRSGRKRELSVGYTADIEEIDGKYYMKNIRGNHIALCEAGRAGNARIRDSKTVVDKSYSYDELKKYYTGKKTSHGSDIFLIEGKYCVNPNISNERYNSIEELEAGELAYFRRMAGHKDGAFADFEAKGSFDSLDDLINFYKGATTEAKNGGIVVRLQSGVKLFYSFLNGTSGKLLFVRKITDSDGTKVVEVLGDSVKFKEGQRVKYFGTDCVVSRIYPLSGKFFIELTAGGNVAARFTYDQAEESVNAGVLQLRDSVVFDSKSGKFGFADVELDDPAHEKELDRTHYLDAVNPGILRDLESVVLAAGDYTALKRIVMETIDYDKKLYRAVYDEYERCASRSGFTLGETKKAVAKVISNWGSRKDSVGFKYKPGDVLYHIDEPKRHHTIAKCVEESGVHGPKTKKYIMKNGNKYVAEDIENANQHWRKVGDSAILNQGEGKWHEVADDGKGVRRFRVVADGRTFETNANSAAHAAQKVARALSDSKFSDDDSIRRISEFVKFAKEYLGSGIVEVRFGNLFPRGGYAEQTVRFKMSEALGRTHWNQMARGLAEALREHFTDFITTEAHGDGADTIMIKMGARHPK